eukprot:6610749-Prymnesium_polylepis.1
MLPLGLWISRRRRGRGVAAALNLKDATPRQHFHGSGTGSGLFSHLSRTRRLWLRVCDCPTRLRTGDFHRALNTPSHAQDPPAPPRRAEDRGEASFDQVLTSIRDQYPVHTIMVLANITMVQRIDDRSLRSLQCPDSRVQSPRRLYRPHAAKPGRERDSHYELAVASVGWRLAQTNHGVMQYPENCKCVTFCVSCAVTV